MCVLEIRGLADNREREVERLKTELELENDQVAKAEIARIKQGQVGVGQGEPAGTRTAAKPTADQMRVLEILQQLADAADWRGVAAQERAASAVAAAVRILMPGVASFVYNILGNAYQSLGDFSKAIEYHTQDLAITKEVGNRAWEVRAYAKMK